MGLVPGDDGSVSRGGRPAGLSGIPTNWPANALLEREDRSSNPYIPHGTYNAYQNYKCSCAECRAANAATQKRYRDEFRNGTRRCKATKATGGDGGAN